MYVPAAYCTILIIWATTPLTINWSNETLTPEAAITLRMVLAAALGWCLTRLLGIPIHWHRTARRTYGFSLIGMFGAMTLTYFGAPHIPSGLISIIYALAPVMSNLLAYRLLGHGDFNRWGWLSFCISFLGLGVICMDNWVLEDDGWIGIVLLLVATFLYSLSGLLVQREAWQTHPLEITVGTLMVSVPCFVALWWLSDGGLPLLDWSSRSPWSVLYLAVFGSLIGFVAYYFLVKTKGATAVNMVTLATPMLALFLGDWLNGEELTWRLLTGSGLIISGLAVYFLSWRTPEQNLAELRH